MRDIRGRTIMNKRIACCILIIAAACTCGPWFFRGAKSSQGDIARVDIDQAKKGAPDVGFEVDCGSLRNIDGSAREFCYANGSWGHLDLGCGFVVACNCGEYGGFLQWYDDSGRLLQTMLSIVSPKCIIMHKGVLICVSGLTHMTASSCDVYSWQLGGSRWERVFERAYDSEPREIRMSAESGLCLVMWEGVDVRLSWSALHGK